MFLTSGEIEDYARRYVDVPRERLFPMHGELFARFLRERVPGKVLKEEEGWSFAGYGICLGYLLNEEAKPLGKSLWWRFVDLSAFPPKETDFRLQPPHVVICRFNLEGGSREMRILTITRNPQEGEATGGGPGDSAKPPVEKSEEVGAAKILQFRPRDPAG